MQQLPGDALMLAQRCPWRPLLEALLAEASAALRAALDGASTAGRVRSSAGGAVPPRFPARGTAAEDPTRQLRLLVSARPRPDAAAMSLDSSIV